MGKINLFLQIFKALNWHSIFLKCAKKEKEKDIIINVVDVKLGPGA